MKRSLKLRIDDILKSIRLIERYIHEKNKSAFEKDITVQDAVIRRLEIIGEATKHVSSEIRYKYKEVPWRKMAGLRDVAIHDYADLLLERIWNTLKKRFAFVKKVNQKSQERFRERKRARMKLNAQELRELEEKKAKGKIREIKRNPIFFILENIYDTYNIGGLFRLADALAIEKMYLCGTTEIPPNTRIKKASIGTYKIVPWEYRKSAKEAIEHCNSQLATRNFFNTNIKLQVKSYKLQVTAVEQHPQSIDYRKAEYRFPLVLIFGNESYGVTEETLKLADQIVEIPMWGINRSLNVIVSAGIVSYWAMSKR